MSAAESIEGPAWDLGDEYESVDDAALHADLDALTELLDEAGRLSAGLAGEDSVAAAQQLARLEEQSRTLLSNVAVYANCLLSVDAQDTGAQRLRGSLQQYYKRIGDAFEPLAQYLDEASEQIIEAYLQDPHAAASEFQVRHRRERRHENLSLSEEKLVNGLSQDGIHAWGTLYDQLAGSIRCEVMVGNEMQSLGVAEAAGLMSSHSDTQRRAAWSGINAAWEAHEESCAAAINAIAGWRLEMCKQRSRVQPVQYLDAPLHMNKIGDATLRAIMDAAAGLRPLAQRAAQLQARAYGKAAIGPWDVRAPAPVLKGAEEAPLPFERAVDIIAEAYADVHPDMGEFVRMMAERRWIEGTVGPRKGPGAHCTSFAKSRNPRVYMTYTGTQTNVITLAHELGHALHGWVMRDLPLSQMSYGMSLAETASNFGEATVRNALLARAETLQGRMDIMWEEISALTAYLLNIPARFEFERAFYEERAQRPLQPAELKELMNHAWREWYGNALSEPDPLFWASKLHFYISGLSFYNFPYLFGYLFSLLIDAQRAAKGGSFYPWFVTLLRDTGRMTAEDLAAAHLGADLAKADTWTTAAAALRQRVDAFADLLDEAGL